MEAVPFVLGKSGRGQESHFQLAYCSRRAVFLNLPTEVRGMASAKTNASGSCHFAKVFPRNARSSSGVARAPSFRTTTARGRSCHFLPFGMRHSDDGSFLHRRMAHEGIFEVHRADPLTAGFHQVLGAVHDLDVAFVVNRGHIAGAEPSVLGPTVVLLGRFVVAGGHPRPANLELARRPAVPRRFPFGAHHAQLDKRRRPALLGADFVFFFVRPIVHVRLQQSGGSQRRGLGHPPQMNDAHAVAVEPPHHVHRRRGAAAGDAHFLRKFPAAGIFFERVQHAQPNRGHAAGNGHALVLNQVQDTFGIQVRSRQHQPRACHHAGKRQAPGVGVKHGGHRQNRVLMSDGKRILHALGERVQHNGAMRIDHSLGLTGGARGVAHGHSVVFVHYRVDEIVAGTLEKRLVIVVARGNAAAGVRNHDDALQARVLGEFFIDREQDIVNDQEAVFGVIGDPGDFVGMQTDVQGIKDAPGAGHSKKDFQMARVVPHHRGHTFAAAQAEAGQRVGEAAGAAVKLRVAAPQDGTIRAARNDFHTAKKLSRALQQGRKREGKIHHRPAHRQGASRVSAAHPTIISVSGATHDSRAPQRF